MVVSSSTSIWGTDPADIGRYYGLANLFIPFPAFSNAMGAQIAGLAEVLFPINSGVTASTTSNPQSLYAGWLQQDRIMALLTTGQWTFDTTPVTEPNGTTHPPEGVWNYAGPITFAGSATTTRMEYEDRPGDRTAGSAVGRHDIRARPTVALHKLLRTLDV